MVAAMMNCRSKGSEIASNIPKTAILFDEVREFTVFHIFCTFISLVTEESGEKKSVFPSFLLD
jgi:hypothetical protein